MKQIVINSLDIFKKLGAKIFNEKIFNGITNISSLKDANVESLIFVDSKIKNKGSIITTTKAKVIICDYETYINNADNTICFIVDKNPKLLFAEAVTQILKEKNSSNFGIHPTAVIHQNANIDDNVFIGANCSIGNSKIGSGTIIHPGCHIYDEVIIGRNVIIDSGTIIGAPGFGFVRDEKGVPLRFPQLGGVIIEDDVEIGANTCIDRGALNDTIIRKGVKIDNFVQISHNVEIGKYTYIIGKTGIGGSVTIGENCWVATSDIKNKIKIGDNVTIGYGALVLKSVKSNSTVMGNPATSLENYSKLQYRLRKTYSKL